MMPTFMLHCLPFLPQLLMIRNFFIKVKGNYINENNSSLLVRAAFFPKSSPPLQQDLITYVAKFNHIRYIYAGVVWFVLLIGLLDFDCYIVAR